MNFVKSISLLFANPSKGWQEISKYSVPKDIFLSKIFYPAIGILAISSFVSFFYESDKELSYYLQNAITEIGKYFFGYMISAYILCVINSEYSKSSEGLNKVHLFSLYCYTLLVIFAIIENFLPPNLIDIFNILPLYLVFIIWKGYSYMKIDLPESKFIFIFSLSIMVPYYLLSLIFNLAI